MSARMCTRASITCLRIEISRSPVSGLKLHFQGRSSKKTRFRDDPSQKNVGRKRDARGAVRRGFPEERCYERAHVHPRVNHLGVWGLGLDTSKNRHLQVTGLLRQDRHLKR